MQSSLVLHATLFSSQLQSSQSSRQLCRSQEGTHCRGLAQAAVGRAGWVCRHLNVTPHHNTVLSAPAKRQQTDTCPSFARSPVLWFSRSPGFSSRPFCVCCVQQSLWEMHQTCHGSPALLWAASGNWKPI